MNEESLKIIVSQKRENDDLHDYVDAGFRVICDWGKQDHKKINTLTVCVGVMFGIMFASVRHQNRKIRKLENKINELTKGEVKETDNDPLEKVSAE